MTVRHYTGIGSRQTPAELGSLIAKIARVCANDGLILRSGAAPGADAMFEQHARARGGACEIWVPWRGFQGHPSTLVPVPEAFAIASEIHPAWDRCSDGARKLHARNVHQVLGADLQTPSEFVVCWTPRAQVVGGTATALRLAKRSKIPIMNLAHPAVRSEWETRVHAPSTQDLGLGSDS